MPSGLNISKIHKYICTLHPYVQNLAGWKHDGRAVVLGYAKVVFAGLQVNAAAHAEPVRNSYKIQ